MKSKVKCVVWDLDNTLWYGTLLEDKNVSVNPDALNAIREFDRRGILQSIASRNEYDHAHSKLQELNLDEYFLYPQIHWDNKSLSIKTISEKLNIGLDTLVFIDDQSFERDEVTREHSCVETYSPDDINQLLLADRLQPTFITEETAQRRLMYMGDIKRNKVEETFVGTNEEFLSSLQMEFVIHKATEDDLQRAEELTIRTNQLNTTGKTYSYEELSSMIHDSNHEILVASLKDCYGNYGKIGLALIEKNDESWRLKLFLMSCRVMSRGVGTVFINYIRSMARCNNRILYADFVKNDKNRMLYLTYKFIGFTDTSDICPDNMLVDRAIEIPRKPDYLKFFAPESLFNKSEETADVS